VLFDHDFYLAINEARWAVAQRILSSYPSARTCLDIGCGPGWFTRRLVDRGLVTFGVDARPELVAEAQRRVPQASFAVGNIESEAETASLKPADIGFCFGLLYHLENPFAAVRNLRPLVLGPLLIETQVFPSAEPAFRLVAEGRNETQGARFHGLVPSRTGLVKMLYAAGFQHVGRYIGQIDHEDFRDTDSRLHRREIFVASDGLAKVANLAHEAETTASKIDYRRVV
jgi:SAM-dependent methyltransferase